MPTFIANNYGLIGILKRDCLRLFFAICCCLQTCNVDVVSCVVGMYCIYVTVYAETRPLSWKSIRRYGHSKLPSSYTSEVVFFALRGFLMIVEFSYLL